jgi:hypothetical protein
LRIISGCPLKVLRRPRIDQRSFRRVEAKTALEADRADHVSFD